jgi:outer membrane protein TolC
MIDRSQLGVEAALKEYKPDFAVAGGYYYMGAMPPMYEFRFDVKVPLQRARRAAAVAEQRSTVEQARSTYENTRLGLQDRVQEDYQMASTSVRLARLYRDTVLPQARLALESSMADYQTGGVDFLSVLTNFGSVLEYEMAYFDELASYHTAVSRLEEMTGTPIMWSAGVGADVMKRIAAPMIGGIFTSFVLELVVYPAIYEIWKWHFGLKRELALAPLPQGESS